jgi:GNAT superfamily N-acetyltransferase
MITYQVEKFKDIKDEMVPLLEAHYLEVHAFPGLIAFNPAYALYFDMEERGVFHTITVRDLGVLIGYCCAFVYPNLHYFDHLYAVNDVIYVDKEYRHSNVAYNLVRFAEHTYRDMTASVMTFHMKCAIPFKSLMDSRGFEMKEHLYMKYIGD